MSACVCVRVCAWRHTFPENFLLLTCNYFVFQLDEKHQMLVEGAGICPPTSLQSNDDESIDSSDEEMADGKLGEIKKGNNEIKGKETEEENRSRIIHHGKKDEFSDNKSPGRSR